MVGENDQNMDDQEKCLLDSLPMSHDVGPFLGFFICRVQRKSGDLVNSLMMLIIQFIIMSDSQLKKVITKYKEKFDLSKDQFIEFVQTRVELSEKKMKTFISLITDDLNDEFEQDQLVKLLHSLSAFQAGEDITLLDDEQLQKFTKIKFQDKKKRQKNSQKSQKSYIAQENQQSNKSMQQIKNRNSEKENKKETKLNQRPPQIDQLGKKNKNQKRITYEQIDDEDQVEIYVSNNLRDEDYNEERQRRKQKQKEQQQARKKQQKRRQDGRLKSEKEQLKRRQEKQEEQKRERQKMQSARKQQFRRQQLRVKKELQEELLRQQMKVEQQGKKQIQQWAAEERKAELREKSRREEQRKQAREKSIQKQRVKKQQISKRCLQVEQQGELEQKIKKKSSNGQKQVTKLKTIEEQRSDEINLSQSNQISCEQVGKRKNSNSLQVIEDENNNKELVTITQFDKVGQDFMNPVIKYKIVFKEKYVTWRRYSEIEKLMSYLRLKYEGVVLPEMPPKQGFKGNLAYFWRSTVNQQFLDERKEKLKFLLNRLLSCLNVSQDEILLKFLTEEQFQLPNFSQSQSQSYIQTIFGLKDIVFNYNEIRDYGVAYYKYLSEYNKKQINTECSQEYQRAQNIIANIAAINGYRECLNQNFEKRRQIMFDSKLKPKGPVKTDFDRLLEQAEVECQQLGMQYSRYLELKSAQSWQNELIKQKSGQGGETLQRIRQSQERRVERIGRTQKNLLLSIRKFSDRSEQLLGKLAQKMKEWRKKAHP